MAQSVLLHLLLLLTLSVAHASPRPHRRLSQATPTADAAEPLYTPPDAEYTSVCSLEDVQAIAASRTAVKYVRLPPSPDPFPLGMAGFSMHSNTVLIVDGAGRSLDGRDLNRFEAPGNTTLAVYNVRLYLPLYPFLWVRRLDMYNSVLVYNTQSTHPLIQAWQAFVGDGSEAMVPLSNFTFRDEVSLGDVTLINSSFLGATPEQIRSELDDATAPGGNSGRVWGLPVWSISIAIAGLLATVAIAMATAIKCHRRRRMLMMAPNKGAPRAAPAESGKPEPPAPIAVWTEPSSMDSVDSAEWNRGDKLNRSSQDSRGLPQVLDYYRHDSNPLFCKTDPTLSHV